MILSLLHDVAWSFQQGKLYELFFRDGITFATWGLVLVTGLLVLDGWRRGIEQQKRWELEGKLREAQDKPRFRFGLDASSGKLNLWCANLGKTSFILQKAFMRRGIDDRLEDLALDVIIEVGKLRLMTIQEADYKFLDMHDFELWIEVDGFDLSITSDRQSYHLVYANSSVSLKGGCWEARPVDCKRCGYLYRFSPHGIAGEPHLAEQLQQAQQKVDQTCPAHSDKRFVFGEGEIYRPQQFVISPIK